MPDEVADFAANDSHGSSGASDALAEVFALVLLVTVVVTVVTVVCAGRSETDDVLAGVVLGVCAGAVRDDDAPDSPSSGGDVLDSVVEVPVGSDGAEDVGPFVCEPDEPGGDGGECSVVGGVLSVGAVVSVAAPLVASSARVVWLTWMTKPINMPIVTDATIATIAKPTDRRMSLPGVVGPCLVAWYVVGP